MDNGSDRVDPTHLLDAGAASELLAIPASWLLAEARRARIPHVRLGRYVRFNRETLLAWVAGLERGPVNSGRRPVRSQVPDAAEK